MKKHEAIAMILFSIALIVIGATTFIEAKSTELVYGKPLVDEQSSIYVVQVEYGAGHYFVACFDKPEELAAFASLGGSVYTTAGLK